MGNLLVQLRLTRLGYSVSGKLRREELAIGGRRCPSAQVPHVAPNVDRRGKPVKWSSLIPAAIVKPSDTYVPQITQFPGERELSSAAASAIVARSGALPCAR